MLKEDTTVKLDKDLVKILRGWKYDMGLKSLNDVVWCLVKEEETFHKFRVAVK